MNALPVAVLIPTIGRADRLRVCLQSLAECKPPPAEVVVVDQSRGGVVARVVGEVPRLDTTVIRCEGRGVSRALNVGLQAAAHEIALVTHDDCSVAPSWVSEGFDAMSSNPASIVTGRVMAAGDPRMVPSTKDDPEPHDYTGELQCGALFPNNMVLERSTVLAFGGFDERFETEEPAEDNDFCYRWLRQGRQLLYRPDLVVWHHDWRSREELERLYVSYWRGQGVFYAKHLRLGDLTVLRFIARDVRDALRAFASRAIRGRPRWSDPRRGLLRGLPAGLVSGWRRFEPGSGPRRGST